jgi:hypothetical protein
MVVGEAAGWGRGPLTLTSTAPAESCFVKGYAKQFLNIFRRRPRALYTFSLNKTYSNDDLSLRRLAASLQPPIL